MRSLRCSTYEQIIQRPLQVGVSTDTRQEFESVKATYGILTLQVRLCARLYGNLIPSETHARDELITLPRLLRTCSLLDNQC